MTIKNTVEQSGNKYCINYVVAWTMYNIQTTFNCFSKVLQ